MHSRKGLDPLGSGLLHTGAFHVNGNDTVAKHEFDAGCIELASCHPIFGKKKRFPHLAVTNGRIKNVVMSK